MTESNGVNVVLETEFGNIVVALDTAHAPRTAANFLQYIDDGLYDGGRFHRTVTADNNANTNLRAEKIGPGIDSNVERDVLPNDAIAIQVIQGGINPDRADDLRAPITLERTSETGLKHLDGTISMARRTPDSAISDFFLCIGDTPELDFGGNRNPDGQGFAAFGQVIEGMDVVRTIQAQPANGQTLDPVVPIVRARRASA